MRAALITVAALASLAAASPLHKLDKKALVWDIVTDMVYVTVTVTGDGHSSTSKPTTVTRTHTEYIIPTPPSIVAPTSTSTPPPAPTTTEAPVAPPAPPAPKTTLVPVVAPSPKPAAVAPAPAPAAASPIVAVAATPSDLPSAGVYYHNKHRANHSAPAVTWDDDLASSAQVLANTCNFHHDLTIGNGPYGQNIDAQGMSGDGVSTSVPAWNPSEVLANAITNDWYYGEESIFPYNQPSPVEGAKEFTHFSQIVWKGSTTIGCAVAYCDTRILSGNYGWFVVCNYGPEGNVEGEFNTQVTEPVNDPAIKVATPWA